MGDWTDTEIARYLKREATLKQNGLDDADAERLAERLLYRDRPGSGDDRKLCLECKNLRGTLCAKRLGPLRFVMQRCDGFTGLRPQQQSEVKATQ